MKKINIKKLIVISLITAIALGGSLSVYFSYFHRYKGVEKIYNWSKEDSFDLSKIACVEKDTNKDFVIMNLADIQLSDLEEFFNRNVIHKEITKLVNEIKPDLITLTGDQVWSNENLMSLKSIIRWLDDYKIPYAPVFGNHDLGNDYDGAVSGVNKSCTLYEEGKYSLFSRGPSNLGTYGNYIINIKENNKIVRTLYMIDSGYNDHITDAQQEWVKFNADHIKELNGGEYVQGMAFMHKPIPEYYNAYQGYLNDESKAINNVYVYCSLSGSKQNGFFELAKSLNIKDIVSGHEHANNFTIKYDDVRLTFATKTGQASFYYSGEDVNLNGCTYFKINKEYTSINNFYVDQDEFIFNVKTGENIA